MVEATLKYLTVFSARILAGTLLASSWASLSSRDYSRLCLLISVSFLVKWPVLWPM